MEAEIYSLKTKNGGHRKACAQEPHRAQLSFLYCVCVCVCVCVFSSNISLGNLQCIFNQWQDLWAMALKVIRLIKYLLFGTLFNNKILQNLWNWYHLPLYKWGNWVRRTLHNLSKVMYLVGQEPNWSDFHTRSLATRGLPVLHMRMHFKHMFSTLTACWNLLKHF